MVGSSAERESNSPTQSDPRGSRPFEWDSLPLEQWTSSTSAVQGELRALSATQLQALRAGPSRATRRPLQTTPVRESTRHVVYSEHHGAYKLRAGSQRRIVYREMIDLLGFGREETLRLLEQAPFEDERGGPARAARWTDLVMVDWYVPVPQPVSHE